MRIDKKDDVVVGDGDPAQEEQAWLAIAAYQTHTRDAPCAHLYCGRLVDGVRRRVTCRECGKELDPFDCLLEVAQQHERTAARLSALKAEAETTRKRLDNLLREEANARARVKRLQDKGTG